MKSKQQGVISVERKVLALDTLASGIAQDFNEILAAIMGYTEIAMLDSPKGSQIQKNLKQAMTAIERAKDLVNDLQVFSRQKELERKTFPIRGHVKDILGRFRKSLPGKIQLQDNIVADTECVHANPKQIQQIVVNLCSNASDVMLEAGGTIAVSLETVTIEKNVDDSSMQPGRYFCLTVADTGKGIEEDILDRIFDPYFTTTHTGVGYGMGLAVVLSIVNALKGAIQVENRPEKGATFRVYLPVAGGGPV